MNVGFITGIWQRREPHFLPRDGMGAGSSWRPWAGAMGWGCRAEPLHSPTAELGPLLPLPELAFPLRTTGWNHVPASPLPHCPAGENGLAFWPLPPTASCFAALASLDGDWVGVGKGRFPAAYPCPGRD